MKPLFTANAYLFICIITIPSLVRARGRRSCGLLRKRPPKRTNTSTGNGNGTQNIKHTRKYFNRIATHFVCTQIEPNCNTYTTTSAEYVTTTEDGMTVIYNDIQRHNIGFVNITDAKRPSADGVVELGADYGIPTHVQYWNGYALATVNTKKGPRDESLGKLVAINVHAHAEYRSVQKEWILNATGIPSYLEVSPDGAFIVIIMRARSAGSIIVVRTDADLAKWTMTPVSLSGLKGVRMQKHRPDPIQVAINKNNVAVITLQENNALVMIDLENSNNMDPGADADANNDADEFQVTSSFPARRVKKLKYIDIKSDFIATVNQNQNLTSVRREPSGVTYINDNVFVTTDQGNRVGMKGGSRSISFFDVCGTLLYTSNSELEHIAASLGQYSDSQSGYAGIEPWGVEFGVFGGIDYLFITARYTGLVYVYRVSDVRSPIFKQVLPVGIRPRGMKAVPQRNILIVASSRDLRDHAHRSSISIHEFSTAAPTYPTIQSRRKKPTGVPIPWGGISGLTGAGDGEGQHYLWAIPDLESGGTSRILTIQTSAKENGSRSSVAIITDALNIIDSNGILAAFKNDNLSTEALSLMINNDNTVNLDAEGIAFDGTYFWICTEGRHAYKRRPNSERLNAVMKINSQGVILDVFAVPDAIRGSTFKKGLEGIAYADGFIVVTFQWALDHDTNRNPLILRYNVTKGDWIDNGVYYPLDQPESQNDANDNWVGINDISYKGDGVFYVIERDNQAGLDAAIKRIYSIRALDGVESSTLNKTLVKDLIEDGDVPTEGGFILENPEGLAVTSNGVWLITDNDSAGIENSLINLGNI